MAKSLGQIHTINTTFGIPFVSNPGVTTTVGIIDLPGELSQQLQRNVRAGNMFKVVGIDMSMDLRQIANRDHVVQGFFRYYAPTRGRCAAFRSAFKSMAEQMANQGISMRDNKLYDFRAPLNTALNSTFRNQATLNGTDGLALRNDGEPGASIFGVHNAGVRPTYTGTDSDLYSEGFKTLLSPAGTDFVLNDTPMYAGNEDEASLTYEEIPFQMKLSSDLSNNGTSTFHWRPDPALYLAILCGQLNVVIENSWDSETVLTQAVELDINVMVSGWKSIMGNPDKKSSSKKSSKKMRK